MANAIGTRKKASRNRFMNELGYTMYNTRISKSEHWSKGEKEEFVKQTEDFRKKLTVHANKEDIDFGWWRMIDGKDLCYSEVEDQHAIEGIEEDDNYFQNKIGKSVYNEYMTENVCAENNDESSIASLARVDVWILLVAKFGAEERKQGNGLQKKYAEAQAKYLPLAVQQILIGIRLVVIDYYENELTIRLGCASDDADMFNNNIREITKVVTLPSTSRCYINVCPKWFVGNISSSLGMVLDVYIGMFDSQKVQRMRNDEMSIQLTAKNCQYDYIDQSNG